MLPCGRTRVVHAACGTAAALKRELEIIEAIPCQAQRLVRASKELTDSTVLSNGCVIHLRLRVAGGGGDQPDWTERGKMPSGGSKKRGPDARAPDWASDPAKKAAKHERDLRERGELVVAIGPYCVPCGKRFAKQTVYDAHLSGTKHLRALQRMGRTEEAMVCQLDVEANKRKIAEREAAREAELMSEHNYKATGKVTEDEERKRAEREEKLRQRAMMPMPATVCAKVVEEAEAAEAGEQSSEAKTVVAAAAPVDDAALASAGSGTKAHT